MRQFSLALAVLAIGLSTVSCGGGAGGDEPGGDINPGGVSSVTQITSSLSVNISTDKACYRPGETVTFTADNLPAATYVRYRTLIRVISEQPLSSKSWSWTPPSTDFTGYMVDLYQKPADGTENIVGSIAVDVSSDWTQFPRYGFVAAFGSDKNEAVVKAEMQTLARYHINGVQFQDWHYKHHWPLGGTRDNLLASYLDIAKRTIYTSVVKSYIAAQHAQGMKAMFYNLCYGALDEDGAAADGVKPEWYIFKDTRHAEKDYHALLQLGWKSNIYLLDPSNTDWQKYIAQRNDDVYANFDFDGYQIDQLGSRGARYGYNGQAVDLSKTFAPFINAMKAAHPSKRLVMNAVSGYGSPGILGTGKVDFCYNEVWDGEAGFSDLRNIILANDSYSSKKLKTVFAAYMNYDKGKSEGYFNMPGILLTDAVIFALGGSHLELGGDHMLCNEYFPSANLKMSATLKSNMIRYYDFLTAYQNLLRGGNATEINPSITCASTQKLSAWTSQKGPQAGSIVTYSKQVDNYQVIHLLNFVRANSVSWRDADGDMPEASTITAIALKIAFSGKATKVWLASPDQHGGVPQQLAFSQSGSTISVTIPQLKYWDMIVIQ